MISVTGDSNKKKRRNSLKSKTKNNKANKKKEQKQQIALAKKQEVAKKRERNRKINQIITTVMVGLVVGIAIGLPLAVIDEPKTGIVITLGVACLLFSIQFPKLALWTFLIYLPFAGTVTYWVGNGSPIFQLAKDVFYIPALFGIVLECLKKRKPIIVRKNLLFTLGLLLGYCVFVFIIRNTWYQLTIENVGDLGSPFLVGIIGIKVFLGYIPLIFCAYYLIDDKKKLIFLGRLMVILAIICCSLALVQYWMLDSGRCVGTRGLVGDELFKATLDAKCFVGGALTFSPEQGQIRLPGTFVSPWHWAWFLIANGAISLSVALSEPTKRWRFLGFISAALIFVNAIICGQRAAFVMVPAVMLLTLTLTSILTKQTGGLKKIFSIVGAIILIAILAFILLSQFNPDFIQQRVDSFVSRWNSSPPHLFLIAQIYEGLNVGGILGVGLGAGTNSARVFGDVRLFEVFHAKVIFEIGVIGFILFMAFVSNITILGFQDTKKIQDSLLNSFGSSFWVFVLIISYYPQWYPLDTDPVAIYYWFFAGVIFRLPKIDKEERAKMSALEPNDDSISVKGKIKKFRARRKSKRLPV